MGPHLSSVKSKNRAKMGPIGERLALLLDVFSPWGSISLTYRQFAAEIGTPVTETAIKKLPQRKKFPADIARVIVTKTRDRGLNGVTLEWLLWGEGPGPEKVPKTTPTRPEAAEARGLDPPPPPAREEAPGRFAPPSSDDSQAELSHEQID